MRADAPVRLVIVDRDGVLKANRPGHVTSVEQFVWLPGARQACIRLARLGVPLAVVTNQAAIGRGLLDEAGLAGIHARLIADLAADGVPPPLVRHCPHLPAARCGCRKPAPGLLTAVLDQLGTPARDAIMVGDHETDLAAAAAVGCRCIHVRSGRGRPPVAVPAGYLGSVADLAAAVARIAGFVIKDCPQ